jgi:two-component system response regulator WspF
VAWVARDGVEAVELCAQDTPDLVLMDLVMPQMDGVEATRRIMAKSPCAIVVVTASVNQNSSKVFAAMGAGALDAVNTPTLDRPGNRGGSEALLGKIQTISRLIGEGRERPRSNPPSRVRKVVIPHPPLVVIGASAGGPAALASILSHLGPDFPAPVLVIQHVSPQFEENLARWLGHQTTMPVRLARQGDQPKPGTVLVAGTDHHFMFTDPGHVGYTSEPFGALYTPSIDVCFMSAGRHWRGGVVGVLLTGMGRDGAAGLKALRDAGHHTIIQNRATSVVYGMPKAAAEMDAAAEVLPLGGIGPRLLALVPSAGHHRRN